MNLDLKTNYHKFDLLNDSTNAMGKLSSSFGRKTSMARYMDNLSGLTSLEVSVELTTAEL